MYWGQARLIELSLIAFNFPFVIAILIAFCPIYVALEITADILFVV